MRIDGKNLSGVNPTSGPAKTNKTNQAADSATRSSDVESSKASHFALNQSGMDQSIRRANDDITRLQSQIDDLKQDNNISQADIREQVEVFADQIREKVDEIRQGPESSDSLVTDFLNSLTKNPGGLVASYGNVDSSTAFGLLGADAA